jgi:hypothetical protein
MYEEVIEKISGELTNHPLPQKPKTFGKEYEFPEDLTMITSMTLGNWLLKLSAWRGYTIRLLAKAEMEFTIMDDTFNAKVTKQLAAISEKRLTKEQAVGKVLGDEKDAKLKVRVIEKHGQLVMLKRLLEIYTTQFEAISREISRRGIEARLVQQGVSSE